MKNVLEKKDLLLSEKVKLTNQVYRVQEQLNIEEENRKILKKTN
ncbi:hypothetical protein [Halalkalibacter wakoensis]|nr:hypothetical protein [Halalkalibacter wakoensis]